jgi:iron complex transport system ATP-binding protein
MKRDALVRVQDAGVARAGRWILRGVSLDIRPGELCAALGPNGSGKSTLARLLSGQNWPSEGRVVMRDGAKWTPTPVVQDRVRIVQPAAPLDFDPTLSAREVVLTGFFGTLGLYRRPTQRMEQRATALMATVGLSEVVGNEYGLLSTGEKVRAQIARAMAIHPGLLILDEPTSGLDLLARERVLATVRRVVKHSRKTAVVLITHHVEELPPETSEVLVLSRGRVVGQGAPDQVLRSEVLSRAYGVDVEVHQHHGRFYTTVHPRAWGEL